MSGEFKALGSYAGPEIVDSGLVLHLDAGNVNSYPGSGTTWTDLVNRSRTGTLTNGPTYSNSGGGVVVFDGSNDYVTIPNSSDFNFGSGDFTVESWIKLTSSANSYPQIGGTHQGGSGNSGWYYYAATSYASNKQTFGCQTEIQNTQAAISTNVWYHMVASRISNTLTFYQNGVAGASGSYTDNISSSNALLVGNLNSTTNFPATYAFPGQIAIFKVYKGKGLTAAEVIQSYNSTRQRFETPSEVKAGLILDLDAGNASSYSGSGSTWTDLSGNGYNATISGSPTFTSSGTGSYFTLDSSSKYMQASVPKPNLPVTISFWAYPTNVTSTTISLFDTAPSTQNVFRLYSGSVEWWNADPAVAVSPSISSNNWYNFTFIFDFTTNRTVSFYLNGKLIGTSTGSTFSTYAWSTFIIGTVNGGLNVFSGRIAKATIHNRALSALEIGRNFDALRGRFGL